MDSNEKFPEGHFVGMWMGIAIAIFTGVGVPLSIATGNPGLIGIGPAIGVAFGLSVGSAIEAKHKKEGKIRPLTEDEREKRKKAVTLGFVILIALAVLGFVIFLKLV